LCVPPASRTGCHKSGKGFTCDKALGTKALKDVADMKSEDMPKPHHSSVNKQMKPPASTNRSSGKTSEQWRDLILVHNGEKDLMNSRPPDPPGTSRPCGRPPVENLGEILAGDLIENSPYEVKMLENIDCKVLSKHQLDQEMEDKFRSRGTFSGGATSPPEPPVPVRAPGAYPYGGHSSEAHSQCRRAGMIVSPIRIRGRTTGGPLLGSTQPVPANSYNRFCHTNTGTQDGGSIISLLW